MGILNDVNETVNLYFPKGARFNEYSYITSSEFNNLLKIRENYLFNWKFKKDIEESLQTVYKDYAVVDWTDIPHSNCYEFKILMHKNQPILDDDIELIRYLGWKRLDLRVFISILNKYYYYFFEESTYDINKDEWDFRTITEYNQEMKEAINHLYNVIAPKGYQELSTEIANKIVEDVETQYLEKGQVKIFNCLFTDLVTM